MNRRPARRYIVHKLAPCTYVVRDLNTGLTVAYKGARWSAEWSAKVRNRRA